MTLLILIIPLAHILAALIGAVVGVYVWRTDK